MPRAKKLVVDDPSRKDFGIKSRELNGRAEYQLIVEEVLSTKKALVLPPYEDERDAAAERARFNHWRIAREKLGDKDAWKLRNIVVKLRGNTLIFEPRDSGDFRSRLQQALVNAGSRTNLDEVCPQITAEDLVGVMTSEPVTQPVMGPRETDNLLGELFSGAQEEFDNKLKAKELEKAVSLSEEKEEEEEEEPFFKGYNKRELEWARIIGNAYNLGIQGKIEFKSKEEAEAAAYDLVKWLNGSPTRAVVKEFLEYEIHGKYITCTKKPETEQSQQRINELRAQGAELDYLKFWKD